MTSRSWGVFWFLLLAFAIAWGCWFLAIGAGVSVVSTEFQLYALPGAFAPAIAAFVVRKWITREGFADAGLGLHLRRGWPYYLAGWLLPLFVVGVIAVEAWALGIATPDFALSKVLAGDAGDRAQQMAQSLGSHPILPGLPLVPETLLFALVTTPMLWGEEFGWRGYLQQRLLVGRPVASAIVIGIIWGVWHFPLTLRGYNYPDHPYWGSALFVVVTILIAYVFGWIFRRSASIWASSLAHAATNGVGGTLTALWFAGAGPTVVSYSGLLAVPPLLAVCAAIYALQRPKSVKARASKPRPPAAHTTRPAAPAA